MTTDVTIELTNASSEAMLPSRQDFQQWAQAALAVLPDRDVRQQTELSIRVVDQEESAHLNAHYRQKSGPTNILSFPCPEIAGAQITLLGDLAICAPLVREEALAQDKPVNAHWAHLTVHGVLHLRGFDHEDPAEADTMESMEIRIMDSLGYPDPYHQDVKGDE